MPSLKLSLDREGTDEDANETPSVGLSSLVTANLKHEVIVAGIVTLIKFCWLKLCWLAGDDMLSS